jgi:hypothetical protein
MARRKPFRLRFGANRSQQAAAAGQITERTGMETDGDIGRALEPEAKRDSSPDHDLDADLESGIAAILTRLQKGEAPPDAAAAPDPAVTLALLGELDRLWRKPAA